MGLLSLSRLKSTKRGRRIQAVSDRCTSDESIASEARRKNSSCRPGGNYERVKPKRLRSHLTLDSLPPDVMHQILTLLPMQDAARAACVSRELLRSWRYYPELEFSAKTLSLDEHTSIKSQMAKGVIRRIDDTLQNRAGIWVKRLKFKLGFFCKLRACYINQWLDAAATFGLEELTLELPRNEKMKYKFPCKLFFGEKECSMQSLCLYACAFPTEHGSCSFRSLKRVEFRFVHITTEESLVFLSSSLVLEHLEIGYCHEIFCLRIPCTLQLLNVLRVERCSMLETIESDAPNLSTFHYEGPIIQFLLEDTLQLKDVNISIYPWFDLFDYAFLELPMIAPNIETLFLMTADESLSLYSLNIVPNEIFHHLRYLELAIVGPRKFTYDFEYYSLVSYINGCPALQTFILHVEESSIQKSHLVIDPSTLVKLQRHCHKNIKHVTITGFSAMKALMELIFYILENAASLQSLTLDIRTRGFEDALVARIAQDTRTRDYQEWQNNFSNPEELLRRTPYPDVEAYLAHIAIGRYIIGRLPPSADLKVLGAPPDEIISFLSESERWWPLSHTTF
ncbi:hypothetical protein QOZ80_7BG0584910 [Eleusine coracana subsp. coracana]|nr:hypothetical protein QOZ80_7BG0584910 [Eleusine coracana subsp. coracana]